MARRAWARLPLTLLVMAAACGGSSQRPTSQDSRVLTLADMGSDPDSTILPLMDGPPPAPDVNPCPTCDDGDPCTEDICQANGSCRFVPVACDDGDPCTDDRCEAGGCVHAPKCADDDPCTEDRCAAGVCSFPPKSCDDGDPCTVDSCSAGQCAHPKGGQTIYRHYNAQTGAHAYTVGTTSPPGFSVESAVWRTFAAAGTDRQLVYQMVQPTTTDHMLTLDATEGIACCAYVNGGDIGYAYNKSSGTLIPVYRLNNPSAGLHLSSTSASEGTSGGYQLETTQFYVCPK